MGNRRPSCILCSSLAGRCFPASLCLHALLKEHRTTRVHTSSIPSCCCGVVQSTTSASRSTLLSRHGVDEPIYIVATLPVGAYGPKLCEWGLSTWHISLHSPPDPLIHAVGPAPAGQPPPPRPAPTVCHRDSHVRLSAPDTRASTAVHPQGHPCGCRLPLPLPHCRGHRAQFSRACWPATESVGAWCCCPGTALPWSACHR